MTPDPELEALLDGIWLRRRTELRDRVEQMSSSFDRVDRNASAWGEVGAEAHRLTGALGSLGFDDLALRARTLERTVTAEPNGPRDPRAVRCVIDGLKDALRAATSRPSP